MVRSAGSLRFFSFQAMKNRKIAGAPEIKRLEVPEEERFVVQEPLIPEKMAKRVLLN